MALSPYQRNRLLWAYRGAEISGKDIGESAGLAAASNRQFGRMAVQQKQQEEKRGALLAGAIKAGALKPEQLSSADLKLVRPKMSGADFSGGFLSDIGDLVGNLGEDLWNVGKGLAPAVVAGGKAALEDVGSVFRPGFSLGGPTGVHSTREESKFKKTVIDPTIDAYKYMYAGEGAPEGSTIWERMAAHPLQPLLDVATVASLGTGGAIRGASALSRKGISGPGLDTLVRAGRTDTRSPLTLNPAQQQRAAVEFPEVPRLYSSRPLMKAGQVAFDKIAENVGPVGEFATNRVTKRMQREAHSRGLAASAAAVRAAIQPLVGSRRDLTPQEAMALDYALRGWNTPEKIQASREMFAASLRGELPDGFNITDFEGMFRTPEDARAFVQQKADLGPEVEALILSPSERMINAAQATREAAEEGFGKLGLTDEEIAARVGESQRILDEFQAGTLGQRPDMPPPPGPIPPPESPPEPPVGPEGPGPVPPPAPGTPNRSTYDGTRGIIDEGEGTPYIEVVHPDDRNTRSIINPDESFGAQFLDNTDLEEEGFTPLGEVAPGVHAWSDMEGESPGLEGGSEFGPEGFDPRAMGEGNIVFRVYDDQGNLVAEGNAQYFAGSTEYFIVSPDDSITQGLIWTMRNYEQSRRDPLGGSAPISETDPDRPPINDNPGFPASIEGVPVVDATGQSLRNMVLEENPDADWGAAETDLGLSPGLLNDTDFEMVRRLQDDGALGPGEPGVTFARGTKDPDDEGYSWLAFVMRDETGNPVAAAELGVFGDDVVDYQEFALSPGANLDELAEGVVQNLRGRRPLSETDPELGNLLNYERDYWEGDDLPEIPDTPEALLSQIGEGIDETSDPNLVDIELNVTPGAGLWEGLNGRQFSIEEKLDNAATDIEGQMPEPTLEALLRDDAMEYGALDALDQLVNTVDELRHLDKDDAGWDALSDLSVASIDELNAIGINTIRDWLGWVYQRAEANGLTNPDAKPITWDDIEGGALGREEFSPDDVIQGRPLEETPDIPRFDPESEAAFQELTGGQFGPYNVSGSWGDPGRLDDMGPGDVWGNPPVPPVRDGEGGGGPQYPIEPTYVPNIPAAGFGEQRPGRLARMFGAPESVFGRGKRRQQPSVSGITASNMFSTRPESYLRERPEVLASGAARVDPASFVEQVAKRERDLVSSVFSQELLGQLAAKGDNAEPLKFATQEDVHRRLGPDWVLVNEEFPLQWFAAESNFARETIETLENLRQTGKSSHSPEVEQILTNLADIHAQDFVRTAFNAKKLEGVAIPREYYNYQRRLVTATDPFDNKFGRAYARYMHRWRAFTLAYMPRWAINTAIGSFFLNMVKGVTPRDYMLAMRLKKEGVFGEPRLGGVELGTVVGMDYLEPGMLGHLERTTGVGVTPVGERIVEAVQKIEDHFRRASFIHSLDKVTRRRMDTMGQVLVNLERRRSTFYDTRNPVSPRADEAVLNKMMDNPGVVKEAIDDLNTFAYNFAALGPYERRYVRMAVPFWGWYKFISKVAYRLPVEYPGRANIMANLGMLGMGHEDQLLGDRPEWLHGIIPLELAKGRLKYLSTMGQNPFGSFFNPFGPQGAVEGAIGLGQASPPVQSLLSAFGLDTLRGDMVPISPEQGVAPDYFGSLIDIENERETNPAQQAGLRRFFMGLLRSAPQFRMGEQWAAGGRSVYPESIPFFDQRAMPTEPRDTSMLANLGIIFGAAPKTYNLRGYQKGIKKRVKYAKARNKTSKKRLKKSDKKAKD